MDISRRSTLIYSLLALVWVLVVCWQVEEHMRIREAAKTELRGNAHVIANFLSATIRGQRFRGAVIQDRLEPVLDLLVGSRTNELTRPSELLGVTLLNSAGDPIVSAGNTNYVQPSGAEGEYWTPEAVTFVNPVAGVSFNEGTNNSIVLLPSPRNMTNEIHREFSRPEPSPGGMSSNLSETTATNSAASNSDGASNNFTRGGGEPPPPSGESGGEPRGGQGRRGGRRPPWMSWMSEDEFKALTARRELHGLVLTMSTEKYDAVCIHDLWLRFVIVFFAGISAAGFGLAWRTVARTSELQIRLVRASELNTHLREMNLAAAGLAHETRNPLNIIRGMAQMLSRQPEATAEAREKSHAIVDETDKVTAQLNEFINYSRPREIRRAVLPLHPAIKEVVRALSYDIDEKKVKLEIKGEPLSVEADEQLFRQALFNLLLNAIQALPSGGEVTVVTGKQGASEALVEIRDNGPGVPPERRKEVFKPYFTTNQKGTGLGLAVVQQIVLAHGWEIECLGNEPQGAVFRITHLKVTA